MAVDGRLKRLRALLDRIERLPASARREWMLQEVRSRLVDVETGVQPHPMRAPYEEKVAAPLEPSSQVTKGRAVRRSRSRPVRAAAALRPQPEDSTQEMPSPVPVRSRVAGPDPATVMLGNDEVLWLDDQPSHTETKPADGSRGVAPWRQGLRG
jgi:hypothetical protein